MELDDPYATTHGTGRLGLSAVTSGLILASRYRLEALLAHSHGVMTWRATDQVLSRPVLIHLLEPEDERLGWVLQAARRAATISDSRFLRVLDALEASGQEPWSFVVCEFAIGDSVQTLLSHGPLTWQQAGFIVHEVAAALAPQHARGMFHLRISPDSVIVTSNGNVKIVGFLIDAALRPEPGEDALTWSQQEAIDTQALGSLLYGACTARWPVPPSQPQRAHWGLSPAPLVGLPATSGAVGELTWPAPQELNRQMNPELSAVTMAILRPLLGLVGPSLHSADDVADSLDGVIGVVGAEESLEHLVREHRGLGVGPVTPAVIPPPSAAGTGMGPDQPTLMMAPVDASPAGVDFHPQMDPASFGARAPHADLDAPTQSWSIEEDLDDQEETAVRPIPDGAARVRPAPAPPRIAPKPARSGVLGRRWVLVLVGFVLVALIGLQLRGCSRPASSPPTGTSNESSSVGALEPVEIVSAFDFDPVADGGDQNENSDQAHLAIDGDPSTAWMTLTYLNNPVFGGLKPGVGLVFDLGRDVPVERVSVILANQPNAVQLMVPVNSDPGAHMPPMNTVGEWRVIASDPAAGLQVTLRPEEPVTTRWVMVYFTHLPPVGAALYRSGIAEAYINR